MFNALKRIRNIRPTADLNVFIPTQKDVQRNIIVKQQNKIRKEEAMQHALRQVQNAIKNKNRQIKDK